MLDVFVGTWDARSLFWLRPNDAPIESTGVMESEWILGQRYLEQKYTGAQLFDQEYAGRGLWGYNTTTGDYECVWCDTAACMILCERGEFDTEKKVYIADATFVSPVSGQIMRRRSVITIRSNNEHVLETFIGPEPDRRRNRAAAQVDLAAPAVAAIESPEDPPDTTFNASKVMEIRFSRKP